MKRLKTLVILLLVISIFSCGINDDDVGKIEPATLRPNIITYVNSDGIQSEFAIQSTNFNKIAQTRRTSGTDVQIITYNHDSYNERLESISYVFSDGT